MIETVLGGVDAASWGVTSMHDHLLSDSASLARPGVQPAPPLDVVTAENVDYLRRNMLASADNLRLNDADLIAAELTLAQQGGLRGVVECSSLGLGPGHAGLPALSRATGVAIVAAFGAYVPRTLPAAYRDFAERDWEQLFLDALTRAIPGTAFRAGVLGIMGTTDAFDATEKSILGAAGRAAAATGAAISVRLEPEVHRGLEVLEFLASVGVPAERVILTNADEYMDAAYWRDLAEAGAVLEMCFGTEAVHLGRVENPSDTERLAFFAAFLAAHPSTRHVLGQSVWTKAQLRAHGGYGYAHLIENIVPELIRRGVDAARLQRMLTDEPRRLLDRPVSAEVPSALHPATSAM